MSEQHPLEAMTTLAEQLLDQVAAAVEQSNQDVKDYDEAMDANELQAARIIELEALTVAQKSRMEQYEKVIGLAYDRSQADIAKLQESASTIKELNALDPKRLAKVNKKYKATIEDSKVAAKAVSVQVRKLKAELKEAKSTVGSNFYSNPETGNTMRLVPGLRIPKGNNLDALDNGPVVEFFHSDRGISRRGFIGKDLNMCWASASNSKASKEESLVARDMIMQFCQMNKIKTK